MIRVKKYLSKKQISNVGGMPITLHQCLVFLPELLCNKCNHVTGCFAVLIVH